MQKECWKSDNHGLKWVCDHVGNTPNKLEKILKATINSSKDHIIAKKSTVKAHSSKIYAYLKYQ